MPKPKSRPNSSVPRIPFAVVPRVTATAMGVRAVEELLAGKSNEVICEVNGAIQPVEINWALAADRMYKNKLKPGDLDRFNETELAQMKALCDKRRKYIETMYACANDTADRA